MTLKTPRTRGLRLRSQKSILFSDHPCNASKYCKPHLHALALGLVSSSSRSTSPVQFEGSTSPLTSVEPVEDVYVILPAALCCHRSANFRFLFFFFF